MLEKLRSPLGRAVGLLFFILLLFSDNLFLQVKPDDPAVKYPEIEGLYEFQAPGAGTIVFQAYFKDGSLRTVENGDAESTKFDPVEGPGLQFKKVHQTRGTFLIDFIKDEQGRWLISDM